MECEESINYLKCRDDKSINQKQKIYYYIGQQEDVETISRLNRNKRYIIT